MSVKLCINQEAEFVHNKVMPKILAELTDGKFVKVDHYKDKFIKIDIRKLKLNPGDIGIWFDSENDYDFSENVNQSEQYDLVEVIRSKKIESLYDENNLLESITKIRKLLYNGAPTESFSSTESKKVLVALCETETELFGFIIPREHCNHSNYDFKIISSSNRPDYCEIRSVIKEDLFDVVSISGETRHFILFTQSASTEKKFPLIDELEVAMEAFKRYKQTMLHERRPVITKEQIKLILSKEKTVFSDYAHACNSTIKEAINTADLANKLVDCISEITAENRIIEDYLLRNPAFKQICCNSVKEEVLKQKSLEKEKIFKELQELVNKKKKADEELETVKKKKEVIENAIETLNGTKEELNSELEKLQQSVNDTKEKVKAEITKIKGETTSLEKEKKELIERISKLKSKFKDELIEDSVLAALSELIAKHDAKLLSAKSVEICTPNQSPLVPHIRFTTESPSKTIEKRTELIDKLASAIKEIVADPDLASDLGNYIISATLNIGRIIICGDPDGAIANVFSTIIDSKKADIVAIDGMEVSPILREINSTEGKIIRIQGAFNTLDNRMFLQLSKLCEKILFFDCDDMELLKGAPTEIWQYATLLNLNHVELKDDVEPKYSKINPALVLPSNNRNKEDWDNIHSIFENKAILSPHSKMLKNIARDMHPGVAFDNQFFEDYIEIITLSNKTPEKYERRTIV